MWRRIQGLERKKTQWDEAEGYKCNTWKQSKQVIFTTEEILSSENIAIYIWEQKEV